MTNLIFYILRIIFKPMRLRYFGSASTEDAEYHINFYLNLGLTIALFAIGVSKWFVLGFVALLIQALWRELVTDGHLKRIMNNTESEDQLLDFKCDVITRLGGLSVAVMMYGIVSLI